MLRCGVVMKRPPFPHLPRVDLRSLDFQTGAELFLGGLGAALLIRWIGM